jgi:hypothetical protein
MFQMAQALVACIVMPYSPTKERQLARTARLAKGSLTVTLTAGLEGVDLPFGADRTLLYWIFDWAVKNDSRWVPLEKITPYLKEMEITDSGTNYADFLVRLERLIGMVLGIRRTYDNTHVRGLGIYPVFSPSMLPEGSRFHDKFNRSDIPAEYRDKVGVLISPEVFADLKNFHIAIPKELLIRFRKRPKMLDMILFLQWRGYAAQSESPMTLDQLREQIGHSDSNPWRFKELVVEAIGVLKSIWPEFDCAIESGNLVIRPAQNGVQLLLEGGNTRKLPKN